MTYRETLNALLEETLKDKPFSDGAKNPVLIFDGHLNMISENDYSEQEIAHYAYQDTVEWLKENLLINKVRIVARYENGKCVEAERIVGERDPLRAF